MSFTTQIKDELSSAPFECSNCEKAMLSSLLRCLGSLKLLGNNKIGLDFITSDAAIARFALSNFREIYDLDAVLTYRRSVMQGTRSYLIELLPGIKLIGALIDLGVIAKNDNKISIASRVPSYVISSECCSASYLRGAFLGSGYISEPRGDFHFEISFEDSDIAKDIQSVLSKKDIKSGVCKRRSHYIVYIKSGQGIADFLAFSGAHKSALTMEEVRVYKSIANTENRRANADIANSKRSIDACWDQLINIKKIVDNYGLDSLSPALKQFIALRIKYRDLPLSELGKKADPPISKSALNGRVRRLEKIASSIK